MEGGGEEDEDEEDVDGMMIIASSSSRPHGAATNSPPNVCHLATSALRILPLFLPAIPIPLTYPHPDPGL